MLTVKSFPRFTLVVCSLILSALPTYALSVPTQYAAANELYNCKPGSLSQTRHFSDPNAASERRWFDILPRFANAFRSNKPIREATVELDDAVSTPYSQLAYAKWLADSPIDMGNVSEPHNGESVQRKVPVSSMLSTYMGMLEFDERSGRTYLGGARQREGAANEMLHDPVPLFLPKPTAWKVTAMV